jgi:hypothetical protein
MILKRVSLWLKDLSIKKTVLSVRAMSTLPLMRPSPTEVVALKIAKDGG